MDQLDLVLFDYISRNNPCSNEDLKRYLKRYPEYREDIIEFTANWRAFSILDRVLPPPQPDPAADREMMHRAKAHLRRLMLRRPRTRAA